ncbi:nucleotidyltransferase domain-containing protein [Angustibacter luteus]|uniref:Nucleotidyltransferase domain-containing protein n=1 Tax=Angustibacter luteus TaxID=658456 RepID=A0ABW1JJP5_9ACTN
MTRPDPVETARALVLQRFPGARAAWLGGSIARGDATATSDLDVTVLLAGPPAPFRESLVSQGWPVELFVHDEGSLRHYCEKDQARRQPTIQRLVGESVVLLDTDGAGALLAGRLLAEAAAGPRPLTEPELASARYTISDQLDDLVGALDDDERLAVAVALHRSVGDLALTGRRRWTGTGKGQLRELRRLDADEGTTLAGDLPAAVRAAAVGEVAPLVRLADAVLEPHGGRLFDGHRVGGEPAPERLSTGDQR